MDMEDSVQENVRQKPYFYWFSVKAMTRLEFAEMAIWLFIMRQKFSKGKELQQRFISMLAFYLVYGYTQETRLRFVKYSGYTDNSVRQMTSLLTKLGYIVRNKNNFKIYELSPRMKELSSFINKRMSPEYVKGFGFIIKEPEG